MMYDRYDPLVVSLTWHDVWPHNPSPDSQQPQGTQE